MKKSKLNRVFIIGGTGFVGSETIKILREKKISYYSIGSKNCDLLNFNSSIKFLKKKIKKNDIILFISAVAPCKNIRQLSENLRMLMPITDFNIIKKISNFIYISSDAVYSDTKNKITEISETNPDSLHGKMHLIRENILKNLFKNKLSIIRPTLIYGFNDPHNGYGPNRFAKLAIKNEDINIFGNGQEIRDHISISDVAMLIYFLIKKRQNGIFNAVSLNPIKFINIAKLIIKKTNSKSKIIKLKRNGPIPHNGLRVFGLGNTFKIFKNFKPLSFNNGINNLLKKNK